MSRIEYCGRTMGHGDTCCAGYPCNNCWAKEQRASKQKPQVFECIGKGGRYTVVATAFGAGTMKAEECLFVYKNEDDVHFVRTHDDFWARMREIEN